MVCQRPVAEYLPIQNAHPDLFGLRFLIGRYLAEQLQVSKQPSFIF